MEELGNMIAYKKIERVLESLKDSTDLIISLAGETVTFERLDSPSISHCHVTVNQGHGIPRLVIFRRPKCEPLAIVPDLPVCGGSESMFEGPIMKADLPAHYVKSLFRFPAARPDWVEGIVCAIVPNSLEYYDDEGRLMFRTPEVSITYEGVSFLFCNKCDKAEIKEV